MIPLLATVTKDQATVSFPAAFSAWGYRHAIVIPQTASVLTDFPVYVKLGDLSATWWAAVKSASVSTAQGSSVGGDIRITQSDGESEVPFDPVWVDGTAEDGELHFKATTSNTGTVTYYIYGGNNGASPYAVDATYGAQAVWSDYELVAHDGKTDSSGNFTPTSNGTPEDTTGKIGPAQSLEGSDCHYISGSAVAALVNGIDTTSVTIQAWVSGVFTPGLSQYMPVCYWVDADNQPRLRLYLLRINTGGVVYLTFSVTGDSGGNKQAQDITALNISAGVLVRGTYSDTNGARAYINGGLFASDSGGAGSISQFETTDKLPIGGAAIDGAIQSELGNVNLASRVICEFRIRLAEVSADWDAAEYANQNAPASWYSVGTVEAN